MKELIEKLLATGTELVLAANKTTAENSALKQQVSSLESELARLKQPALPTVSVVAVEKYDPATKNLSVGWSIKLSKGVEQLAVNVEHSDTKTGEIIKPTWDIPANAEEHGSKYPYVYHLPGMAKPVLRFRILPGNGYTVGTPAEAAVDLSKYASAEEAAEPEPAPAPAPAPPVVEVKVNGPLVITKGGTYRGNFQSNDSDVSVIEIKTNEPVIIEYGELKGAGRIIRSVGFGANVWVRRVKASGLTPTKTTDYKKTRNFVAIDDFVNVVVERCELNGVAGINIGGRYKGNGTLGQSLRIVTNQVRNIDGRVLGGWAIANFVGFNYRGEVPFGEIAWNQVINEPYKSVVEDNINLSNSRGTKESPILIHNNYIQGAYPLDVQKDTYSGGGILADSHPMSVPNPAEVATAHVKVFQNQAVGLCGYTYGIAGGNNIEIYQNRSISSALLADGTPVNRHISGLYGFDYYDQDVTFNCSIHDNVTGIMGTLAHQRNDAPYLPDGTVKAYNNTTLPAGKITLAHEAQEWKMWQEKLASNNMKLGV